MQTKLGYLLSLVVAAGAAALAWTGNLTGWLRSENIVSLNWGCWLLGTLLALGIVRLLDRIAWVKFMQLKKSQREALKAQRQAEIAEIHEARERRVQHNLASVIQTLREPIVGPAPEQPFESPAAAQ